MESWFVEWHAIGWHDDARWLERFAFGPRHDERWHDDWRYNDGRHTVDARQLERLAFDPRHAGQRRFDHDDDRHTIDTRFVGRLTPHSNHATDPTHVDRHAVRPWRAKQ